MNAAERLAELRAALTDLAAWADTTLDDHTKNRQHIAEYLTDSLLDLAAGLLPQRRPF